MGLGARAYVHSWSHSLESLLGRLGGGSKLQMNLGQEARALPGEPRGELVKAGGMEQEGAYFEPRCRCRQVGRWLPQQRLFPGPLPGMFLESPPPMSHLLCLLCLVREVLADSSPSQVEKPALGSLFYRHLGVGQVVSPSWAPPPSLSGQHLATPPHPTTPLTCVLHQDWVGAQESEKACDSFTSPWGKLTSTMGYQGVHSDRISLGTALSQEHNSTTKFHLSVLYYTNSASPAFPS